MKKQSNGNGAREALIETLNNRIQPKRSAKVADLILAELLARGFKVIPFGGQELYVVDASELSVESRQPRHVVSPGLTHPPANATPRPAIKGSADQVHG